MGVVAIAAPGAPSDPDSREQRKVRRSSDDDRKLFSGICSLECDILKVPKHEDAKQISRKSDHVLHHHQTLQKSRLECGIWNVILGWFEDHLGF